MDLRQSVRPIIECRQCGTGWRRCDWDMCPVCFPPPQRERDWTVDPATGRSNSSPLYAEICAEVESIIRSEGFSLINGRADSTARLIVSSLAHNFGLVPEGEATARAEG